jgi:hypothetical protein
MWTRIAGEEESRRFLFGLQIGRLTMISWFVDTVAPLRAVHFVFVPIEVVHISVGKVASGQTRDLRSFVC